MANINVNLMFKANTSAAVNNINQLGQLLNQISTKTTIGLNTGSLQQGVQAARELQIHLSKAVNTDTGRLDLSKFNASLRQSGASLSTLSNQLVNAGATGQQAFARLASSIATAQKPAMALGAAVTNMMKTLGSAAMWSVAYSALNAITQTFTGAIDYAKDLNKALTDIAIVSDLTEKQLADFAKTASKAAKELKTTTTAYAEAALIFYQQGLTGKAVEERANAVMKMAKVTGQTAEVVSDQMTAIWNNFYDGSKSLQYYADVVNALGAATASSTDEIAEGLEKFMSVAETVGLSYEYATAALATVTAQTRQSADVVGTAFKTLFARIQDLELGNTLDDGTTLGSYSEALAKIGVNILDASGNLKEMDTILDEMAEKWDHLTTAQQTATAQSVAGVRQYTQLIALMENWDDMKVNIDIATNAEGTLDIQWDKWADSAEAASERVKESWNQLYSQILTDDLVVGVTNSFADFLEIIGSVIDHMGGIVPMLLTIAGLFSAKLVPLLISFGQHLAYNFSVMTGMAQRQHAATQAQIQSLIQEISVREGVSASIKEELELTTNLISVKQSVERASKNLAMAQRQELETRAQIYESLVNETRALNEQRAAAEQAANTSKSKINRSALRNARTGNMGEEYQQLESELVRLEQKKKGQRSDTKIKETQSQIDEIIKKMDKIKQIKDNIINSRGEIFQKDQVTTIVDGNADRLKRMFEGQEGMSFEGTEATMDVSVENLEKVIVKQSELSTVGEKCKATIKDLNNELNKDTIADEKVAESVTSFKELASAAGYSSDEITTIETEINKLGTNKEKINVLATHFKNLRVSADDSSASLDFVAANMMETMSQFASDEEIEAFIAHLMETQQISDQVAQKLKELQRQKQDMDGAFAQNQGTIAAMGAIGNGLSSLSMAISSFMMLKDALDFSQEMDPMQRFYTIIMGLSMLFPVLTAGISLLSTARTNSLTKQFLENKLTEEQFNLKLKHLSLADLYILKEQAENAERKETIALLDAEIKKRREKLGLQQQETGTPGGKNNFGGKMGGSLGGIIGVVAVIAAIAAVGVAIYGLVKHADYLRNKTKKAFEEASQAAEDAKKHLEKVNQEYQNLVNNIKDYKDGLNAIHELTAGTQEFRDAISESNQKALELIGTYKDLEYSWQGDLLVIDDASLASLQKAQSEARIDAMSANYAADQNKRAAQLEHENTELARAMNTQNQRGTAEDKAVTSNAAAIGAGGVALTAGIAAAAILGTVLTGGALGVAIGGAILAGGAVGGLGGALAGDLIGAQEEATEQELEALDALADAYEREGDKALDPEEWERILTEAGLGDNPELLQALKDNTKAVQDNSKIAKQNKDLQHEQDINLAMETLRNIDSVFEQRDDLQQKAEAAILVSIQDYLFDKKWGHINIEHVRDIENAGTPFENYAPEGDQDVQDIAYGIVDQRYADRDREVKKITKIQGKQFVTKKDGYRYTVHFTDGGKENTSVSFNELLTAYQEYLRKGTYTEAKETITKEFTKISNIEGAKGIFALMAEEDLSALDPDEFNEFKESYEAGSFDEFINSEYKYIDNDFIKNQLQYYLANPDQMLALYADRIQEQIEALQQTASQELEVDAKALKMYGEAIYDKMQPSLKGKNGWDKEKAKKTAAEAAIGLTRLNKAFNDSNEVLKTNQDLFKDWNENNIATYEAASELSTALSGLFGGIEVSAKFIKTHLKEIQAALSGDLEALKELQLLAAKETVISLSDDKEFINTFNTILENLSNFDSELNEVLTTERVFGDIDSSNFFDTLNAMVQQGKITQEDINKIFGSIGYTPTVGFVEVLTKNTTKQLTTSKTLNQDGTWGPEETTVTETTTYSTNTVPYYGGEKPKIVESEYVQKYKNNEIGEKELFDNLGGNSVIISYDSNQQQGSFVTDTSPLDENGMGSDALTGAKDKKNIKKAEDEIERYHKIEKAVSNVTKEMDLLAKAKDRAFGASKISIINKEIEQEKKLLALEQKRLKEIQVNYQQDQARMIAYGAKFDAYGQIINYDQIKQSFLNQLNNKTITDEEYEEFNKALTQYEETVELYQTQLLTIYDLQNSLFDREVEKVSTKIEFEIEIKDDELKLLDFQLKQLSDTISDTAKSLHLLGEQTAINFEKMNQSSEGINKILELSGFTRDEVNALLGGDTSVLQGKNLTAGQLEEIEKYRDTMLETTEALLEMRDTIEEKVTTAFERMNQDMNDQISTIEHLGSVATSYRDIIDLVGKDNLGISDQIYNDLNASILKSSEAVLRSTKAKLEADKQALVEAEEALDAARARGEEKDIELWTNVVNTIARTVEETESELMSKWQEDLEQAADIFASAVEQVIETFEKAMSGISNTFEELQNKYDQQSEINSRYLDDYTKIYELSKLSRNISKTINEKDSVLASSKLKDIQEEVNALQASNTEVTEYELKLLQAKYDLRLAEIALEEAQNAKSQVRMQRDSEGNWGYVYTADQEKIDKAQQGYEDKLYDMQELMTSTGAEIESQLIALSSEFTEALKSINEDLTISEEERQRKIDDTTAYYRNKQQYLLNQYQKVLNDSAKLYDEDWKRYSESVGYKISSEELWIDTFEESVYSQLTGFTTVEETMLAFDLATSQMLSGLEQHYKQWKESVNTANKEAGISTEEFANIVTAKSEEVTTKTGEAADTVRDLAIAGAEGFGGLVDEAEGYLVKYGKVIDEYVSITESWGQAIIEIKKLWQDIEIPDLDINTTSTISEKDIKRSIVAGGKQYYQLNNGSYIKAEELATATYDEKKGTYTAKGGKKFTYYDQDELSYYTSPTEYVNYEQQHGDRGTSPYFNRAGQEEYVNETHIRRLLYIPYKTPLYTLNDKGALTEVSVVGSKNGFLQSIDYFTESDPRNGKVNMNEIQNRDIRKFEYTDPVTGEREENFFYRIQVYGGDGKTTYDRWVLWDSVHAVTGEWLLDSKAEDRLAAREQAFGFDTGGYTGSWDSSGRLALLHQKEIVLNASDTANFLAAIDILRDITRTIDLNAMQQRLSLQQNLSATSINPNAQNLEQQVTIHAEFPNATNHTEIEQAFDTLINRASQYAFRT